MERPDARAGAGVALTSAPATLNFIWQVGAKLPPHRLRPSLWLTNARVDSLHAATDAWLIATLRTVRCRQRVCAGQSLDLVARNLQLCGDRDGHRGRPASDYSDYADGDGDGTAPSVTPVSIPLTSPGTLSGTFT